MDNAPFLVPKKDDDKQETNELNNLDFQNEKLYIKDLELKFNNRHFNLQYLIESNYIYFKLFELKENSISPTYYKKRLDLKTIISSLKIKDNDLNKILELINNSYNSNNLRLSIKNNNFNILIKIN